MQVHLTGSGRPDGTIKPTPRRMDDSIQTTAAAGPVPLAAAGSHGRRDGMAVFGAEGVLRGADRSSVDQIYGVARGRDMAKPCRLRITSCVIAGVPGALSVG